MEAGVAAELEALRAEVAALKDVQARWRANGLDKLDGGRGQSHGFGAARLGPWGLQLSGDEITRYGGLSTLGGPVTLKPYPGVYLNNTFSRTPNADYPFTAIFGPPDRTFALHSYLSAAALAGMRTLIVSGSSHVDLVASLTGGDAPYDIALTVAVDADGNAFKMNYANVDALLLPARTSDPASAYGTTDGNLFYRSDTDKLRLRANGAFVNLLTSGDTPAARYIPLPLTAADDARTGVRVVTAYDAHGSLSQYGPHVDNADADATFKQLRWGGIHVPADFASDMTLKFLYSSSVASNNAVFAAGARETLTGATGHTTSLNEGANGLLTLACPGVANTLATGSVVFDVAPTAGRSLMVGIDINTNHANDSNTGTKTVWDAWLEYTPTL